MPNLAGVQLRTRGSRSLAVAMLCLWGGSLHALGQAAPPGKTPVPPLPDHAVLSRPSTGKGAVRGSVTDVGGAPVSGARIVLISDGTAAERVTEADAEGNFEFSDVSPGTFLLTVTEEGLAPQSASGTVEVGGETVVPRLALRVATANTNVEVTLTRHDLADVELHQEESQRLLGVLPNFLVSYDPQAMALSSGQKFRLSSRVVLDPVSLVLHGVTAGVQQAADIFPGFGQEAGGFGKRYGAVLATSTTAVFFSDAIYPTLFHQDPRYFYKGTGTVWQRAVHAVGSEVIARNDRTGKPMPNYSKVLGNLTAGGLSNLYYPAGDRHGAKLTVENGLLNTAAGGVGRLLQEFLWVHLTTNKPTHMKVEVAPAKANVPSTPGSASPKTP